MSHPRNTPGADWAGQSPQARPKRAFLCRFGEVGGRACIELFTYQFINIYNFGRLGFHSHTLPHTFPRRRVPNASCSRSIYGGIIRSIEKWPVPRHPPNANFDQHGNERCLGDNCTAMQIVAQMSDDFPPVDGPSKLPLAITPPEQFGMQDHGPSGLSKMGCRSRRISAPSHERPWRDNCSDPFWQSRSGAGR